MNDLQRASLAGLARRALEDAGCTCGVLRDVIATVGPERGELFAVTFTVRAPSGARFVVEITDPPQASSD